MSRRSWLTDSHMNLFFTPFFFTAQKMRYGTEQKPKTTRNLYKRKFVLYTVRKRCTQYGQARPLPTEGRDVETGYCRRRVSSDNGEIGHSRAVKGRYRHSKEPTF